MITKFNSFAIKSYNSFSIDAYVNTFVTWESVDDLISIFSPTPPSQWICLGAGNNTLFCGDYSGTVINAVSKTITITKESFDSIELRVEAGLEWDELVEWACERGYWGIENLSLIPGHCGAAPIQNIGAYGVEVKDVLTSVEIFSTQKLSASTLSCEECEFGYRDSIFKRGLKGKAIITAINLKLSKIAKPIIGYKDVEAEIETLGEITLENIRKAICSIRERKLPSTKEIGNAGSFFKNPVVSSTKGEELKKEHPDIPLYPVSTERDRVKLAAGWLIEKSGFKGYREGRVGVHDRQALVLINIGGATGSDVIALAQKIQREVALRFGVEIEMEVNVIK